METRVIIIGYHFASSIDNNERNNLFDSLRFKTLENSLGKAIELEVQTENAKYNILLLFYPSQAFSNTDENILKNKIDDFIQKIDGSKKILCILHGGTKPWNENNAPELCQDKNVVCIVKSFANEIKSLIEKFEKDYENKRDNPEFWNSVWTIFEKKNLNTLIKNISPLHLALQGFWGISVSELGDDKDGNKVSFVKFGKQKTQTKDDTLSKILNDETRKKLKDGNNKIDESFINLFPNPDTFKIPEKAEFNYLAPLFDMVYGHNGFSDDSDNPSDNEKALYEALLKDALENAGIKLEEMIKVLDDIKEEKKEKKWEAVNFDELKEDEKLWFKIKIDEKDEIKITYKIFFKLLFEITAILAKTGGNCTINNKIFGYVGNNGNEIEKICNSLKLTDEHCKINDNGYKTLKVQILNWGIKKAMAVIAGIEKLSEEYFMKE